MKKIIISIFIIALFTSCEEILDQQVPAHQNVDETVVTDQKGAETALIGVYSYLASAGYMWEWHYCMDFGHLAGTTRGSGSSSGGLEAGWEGQMIWNQMLYDFSTVLSRWKNGYLMVNAANWMIKLTEDVDDELFAGNKKAELLSEARFLRFFANFYLFRHYAQFWDINSGYGIIIKTDPSNQSNHIMARNSVAESYNKMLEDLDYCIANGPEITDVYHVSKYAAKAFKAKLLAMRGTSQDWEDVKTLTSEVINSGKFSLEVDHYQIFKKRNKSKEVIFSRYFSPLSLASDLGTVRCRWSGYYRSTDWVKNLSPLKSQYQKAVNDTIATYTPSTGVTDYNYGSMGKIASYGLTDAELVANSAIIYMRLAEMHVLKAEAIARTTGDAAQVTAILNPLLLRAKDVSLDPATLTNKDILLEAVYNTLIKELVGESGIDFEASFRFNDLSNGLPKIIVQKDNLVTAADVRIAILPIPMEELKINSLMIQNDGY